MDNQSNEIENELNEVEEKSVKMTKENVIKEIISWVVSLGISVLIAYLFITFVGQFVIVQQSSMVPTLHNNDVLFTQKISTLTKSLKRGDVVTVSTENIPGEDNKHLIKRLIGLPGDTITLIDHNSVIVKDKDGNEQTFYNINPKGYEGPFDDEQLARAKEIKVGENQVYLIGDNRGGSKDSRTMGAFNYDDLRGSVAFRIFPFNVIGTVK